MIAGLATHIAVNDHYIFNRAMADSLVLGTAASAGDRLTQARRGRRNPRSTRLPRHQAARLRVPAIAPQPHLHHASQALSLRDNFAAPQELLPGWLDRGCWSARRGAARWHLIQQEERGPASSFRLRKALQRAFPRHRPRTGMTREPYVAAIR